MFKRECIRCEKGFEPKGRHQKLCEDCIIEKEVIQRHTNGLKLDEELKFSKMLDKK